MKKTKLRSHLRWLVPVIIYLGILVAILAIHQQQSYDSAVKAKETEMALAIQQELTTTDLSISRAHAYVEASSDAMKFFSMEDDRNQLIEILRALVNNTDVTDACICDLSGNGFDFQGRTVSIGKEDYFEEIVEEYAKAGTGMILVNKKSNKPEREVYLVSHVSFEKRENGVIVARFPVEAMSERLFMDKFIADKTAIITLDGQILTMRDIDERADNSDVTSFWEILPEGFSKDTIKLSISQKSIYSAKIPKYGYIVVVPLTTSNGGVVSLISNEEMSYMVANESKQFWDLVMGLVISVVILVLLIVVSNIISSLIEERIRKKRLSGLEVDQTTGLLTRNSAEKQIKSILDDPENEGGLLFLIGIEGVKKDTDLDVKLANARRQAFGKTLTTNFRATDVLARVGEDSYVVFLKGVHSDKDVRKQTDEMQLFLHDMDLTDEKEKSRAHAGAALYPENGRSVQELIRYAEEAYERSKEAGSGRLSF